MARVRDLWHTEVKDPDDPERTIKRKTRRHPDNGGSKSAKRWLAVWIGPDGGEVTKAFRIQDAALKYARKQEEDIARDDYIDPRAGKALVGELGSKWLRLRKVGAGSAARYESTWRNHIEPVFGRRQVKSVQASEVLEWLRSLERTHGNATLAIAVIIIRGTFDLAVADGMRKDNPARSPIIPEPEKTQRKRQVWNVDRVLGVVDAHPEPYRLIPLVSAACGLRQGETFGLALEDLDLEAGTVDVRRQLVRIGQHTVFKLPKGNHERTAPLSAGAVAAIRAYLEAYPPRPYALPWMNADGRLAEEAYTCSLLFRWHGEDPRTKGGHMQAGSYKQQVWGPALVAAGVMEAPERGPLGGVGRFVIGKDDTTHALRHWCSTALQNAGLPLGAVMDFLGHSKTGANLPVTVSVYGHTTEEAFEAARKAVDRSLFRLRAVQDQKASGTVTELASSQG